jgi:uracil-DNA glycosylase
VKPQILVCLGAAAAQTLLGKGFSVIRQRGQLIPSRLAPKVVTTVHPSSILRAREDEARKSQMQAFVRDLKLIGRLRGENMGSG